MVDKNCKKCVRDERFLLLCDKCRKAAMKEALDLLDVKKGE